MTIRITITREGASAHSWERKEFSDMEDAAIWLVQDSYFTNSDVRQVVWERI